MSNTEQSLIFGVPFVHYKTKNWKKYKRYLQESFYGASQFTDFWDDRSGTLPSYCDKVVEVLTPSLQKFADVTHPHPVMITEMWYEKSKKGDNHNIHNHGGSGYSAVLYVTYNKDVHKPTVFYSAFHDPMRGDILQWQPDVEEGDLVIFPSELMHEASPNESDEERLVVSFNIASFQQLRAYNLGISETEKKLGHGQINTKGGGQGGISVNTKGGGKGGF